ncbi:Vgb family protein [Arhodomonas sp. AD133]|uniref:Vgb family protein n=1 Tax=Arhodomonas sp. AD133 TaxID=3415009 RepID=UPI003EB6CE2F
MAPQPGGGPVWYTAQYQGALGRLDPATGETRHIALGDGSRPHGVIVGPDGDAWVTDGGLNAIVRVDTDTLEVTSHPLPGDTGYANLNTAAFDASGTLWFTGQSGIYGRLDPARGEMDVFDAPRGRGPYGITATPDGEIYYASLAGSYVGHVDTDSGEVTVLEPPNANQGARRVWSDADGRIWVSEWNTGVLSRYAPDSREWRSWPLPGDNAHAYAVYVDFQGHVWVSDFGANAVLRFDPERERFEPFPSPESNAAVRQMLGREGEVWAPESGTDTLVRFRVR